ncbi:MAG TPA: ABC transporter permease subunit [Vicinamibacterales bacterium]|nr:ABC transporter permease subunit [Vicinamibacterales bacterium]
MANARASLFKGALAAYFGLFLIFMYGPMLVMAVLSLQSNQGGATFPSRGLLSLYWYRYLGSEESAEVRSAALRSLLLAFTVGLIVGFLALSLAMAYRRLRLLSWPLLYLVLLSLMTPGLLLGLGMTIWWRLLGLDSTLYTTVLGAQVVWALPFGFLVMLSVFNRYDETVEEGARDLGASGIRTFARVTLPIVWPGLFGAALLGMTLSWNEFERTLLASPVQTLPLQIYSEITVSVLEPSLYALGVLTTIGTLLAVLVMLVVGAVWARRTTRAHAAELEAFAAPIVEPEAA